MKRSIDIIVRILAGAGTLLAVIHVLAWLAGRVWSDLYPLSQWLAWIPTPSLAIAIAVGLLCASRPGERPWRRRRAVRLWLATAVVLLAWFAFFEHHLLRRPADPGMAISIVHWNMTYDAADDDAPKYFAQLLRLLGDVTMLVNAGGVTADADLAARLPDGIDVVSVGRVTVLARRRIIEARPLVISDVGLIVMFRIDGGPEFDRPLTIYVVDLPSDPRRSRALITSRLRHHLDKSRLRHHLDAAAPPPPDIVVGDFNIPRGSASIAGLFPSLRDAYEEAGHGYGATFHRAFPLHHIDHTLLGERIRCVRYDLVDPGVGRHRVQRAYVQ